ncbi:MAG: permease-like cell division protein FtsX, partial [Candidatus Paceibacterota bacterium]
MDWLDLKRVFKSGWRNFYEDRSLLTSTLSIMVVVLLLISVLFLSHQMTQALVGELQHKMDVSVYFKQEVSSDKIMNVKNDLKELPEVKEVSYTSQEEAKERFKATFNNNESLMKSLEVVGVNPFLASLNIQAFGREQYDKIASYLNKDSYQKLIDHSNYNQTKETISKVFSISSAVRTGMLSLSIVLAFIAALIAFNTIRLSIVNRKDEISIMRLVGARSWFIRGPFLVQGILIGTFAAVITAGLFSGGLFL